MMDLTHPVQDIAFAEYRSAVREAHGRVELLTESMRAHLKHWRMRPAVEALMTLRGIDLMAAMTVAGEIGDFIRFARGERNHSELCSKPQCSPAIVLWQRDLIRSQAAPQNHAGGA
jgi:transposase